jgi:hypothetical protein
MTSMHTETAAEASTRLPVVTRDERGSHQVLGAPAHRGSAIVQAVNLSRLPFAIDHVALMPDAPRRARPSALG